MARRGSTIRIAGCGWDLVAVPGLGCRSGGAVDSVGNGPSLFWLGARGDRPSSSLGEVVGREGALPALAGPLPGRLLEWDGGDTAALVDECHPWMGLLSGALGLPFRARRPLLESTLWLAERGGIGIGESALRGGV